MNAGCVGIITALVSAAGVANLPAPAQAQDASRSTMTVRDSAGVRVVANTGSSDVAAIWRVPREPLFRVGWEVGHPELEDVTAGVVLSDERVVIGDRGSSLLYVLASRGAVEATMGGDGEGPGEFKSIRTMLYLGADSFLVVDTRNLRITVFERREYLDDLRFVGSHGDTGYSPIGRAGDRYVLSPRSASVQSLLDGNTGWRQAALLMTDSRFEERDSIGVADTFLVLEPDDWNPIRHFGFAVFARGRIALARTDRPQVRWIDLSGRVVQVAHWESTARAATDADWDGFERRLRARDRPDQARFERQLLQRRRDFGGPLPHFGHVLGDRVGNVWLSEYDISRANVSAYFIVSPQGAWLGRVTFPRDIRILDITENRVLGVETDQFDVQAVVLYRLEKPNGLGPRPRREGSGRVHRR